MKPTAKSIFLGNRGVCFGRSRKKAGDSTPGKVNTIISRGIPETKFL